MCRRPPAGGCHRRIGCRAICGSFSECERRSRAHKSAKVLWN
jgi:hypothetical protein